MAKTTIRLNDGLHRRIREASGKRGVSAWLAEAAEARLRREVLREVVSEIIEETGRPITESQRDDAMRWLSSPSTPAG